MKSRALKSLLVGGLAFLVVPLVGCGAAEAEGPGAASPVGYDQEPGPYAPTPGSPEAMASQDAPPQGAPSDAQPAPPGDPADDAEESASQPAPGDIAIGADQSAYTDTDPSALSDFRPALDPYGTWSDDPTYGTVWSPSPATVGDDFAPYVSGGHWAYDDDYTWVSDYSWGWAPFHYGRWVYIGAGRGWSWIPGRSYAGAWVSWRYGEPGYGYVGWAPLAPTWYWRRGVAVGVGFVPPSAYVFVGTRDVFAPGVRGHLVGGAQVPVIAGQTRPFASSGAVVAGHGSARPVVAGPSPSMMNVPSAAVAHAAVADRGVARAQAFARPASAVPLGARAPGSAFRGTTYAGNPGNAAYPGRTAYAQPQVRGGYNGNAAVAAGPQYRGVAPTHFASPSYSAPTYRAPQYAPSYAAPRTAPSYSAPRAAPVYATPRASMPSYSVPRSSPSFAAPRVSSPPAMSRPSFAAPAVRAGGGGGGGGFRGGGGGGHGGHR